jgi:hypothetical protein
VSTASISRAMIPLIALMIEAVSTSETSVNFYETSRSSILEGCHLHTRSRENFKSHRFKVFENKLPRRIFEPKTDEVR